MTPERTKELERWIKLCIATALQDAHADGAGSVQAKMENDRLIVTAEGQSWLVTLQPRL